MEQRTRVGLVYSYNENWIGGTYYILNLIRALNRVEDIKKPTVVLLTDDLDTVESVRAKTQYPYLDFIKYPIKLGLVKRAINKVFSYAGLRVFRNSILNPDINFLYPGFPNDVESENLKRIHWIPDFQEEFLPALFTEKQVQGRRVRRKRMADTADCIVFSSKDSQNHFNTFYPNSKAEQFVLNFAVTHPDLSGYDERQILASYELNQAYYFIPNQFWVHKDHMTVLKALKVLKQQKGDVQFVFSGKEHDHRSIDHVQRLKSYVLEQGLEAHVKFLGFLPRAEQLIILKNSLAVIQPSLFEGWGTVVEDAKAQNKFVFLSDLPVHYEQMEENCVFFAQSNPEDLASKILETTIAVKEKNYQENIVKFGQDFLLLIQQNTATK